MVIEDEPMLLFSIKKKMEHAGFETQDFSSAKEALEYLNAGSNLPDIIWLDYYLKDMNGIEFMHKIKESKNLERIPVLVVSNSASEDKISSMIGLGVKKYFLKADHKLEEIIKDMKEILENDN